MSLRIRLFLLFGGLICGMLFAQWWMWQSLRADMDTKLGDVAFSVGRDMAAVFFENENQDGDGNTFVKRDADQKETEGNSYFFTHTNGSRVIDLKKSDQDAPVKFITRDGKTHQIYVGRKHTTFRFSLPDGSIETEQTADSNGDAHIWVGNQGAETQENHQASVGVNVMVIDTQGDQALHENVIRLKRSQQQPFKVSGFTQTYVNGQPMDHQKIVLSLDDAEDNLIMGNNSFFRSIPIPKEQMSNAFSKVERDFFLGSSLIFLIGLVLVAAAAHRFAEPLRKLADTAQLVGNGKLGLQVAGAVPGGEVGIAINEFNRMSERLHELDEHSRIMREKQSLTELGEVANGLAHTIRNPLNTLGLSIDQMASLAPQNEAQSELAQMARGQIRRIDQWIRSFLALASQGVSREEEVGLDGVLQDVVLEAVQDGRQVEVDVDIDYSTPHIQGVSPELRAVFQALIINSVEASPTGGVVKVQLHHDGQQATVTVTDEGPGLPQQVRDKLFTPHVTTKETGSGMGLFLAHRIITSRYQGSVTLQDHEPVGTRATVVLPLERGQSHE